MELVIGILIGGLLIAFLLRGPLNMWKDEDVVEDANLPTDPEITPRTPHDWYADQQAGEGNDPNT